MSVRKSVGLNQSDSSHDLVTAARFDRFSRRFSVGFPTPAGAEVRARGGVRFGEYTLLMTNMPHLHEPAFAGRAPVLAGGAL
ncbi:hypothetical protein ACGFYZ_40090 [Streptomyces sp. NPDC048330]|uniref:hypothetical protein n=1 Tax=Streptomyces sp. NPDC048330 TaxID=3365533 RepID=UPI00371D11B3